MQEEREAYDQSTTIFSPDGRMFQVEYAREAVKKGSLTMAVKFNNGVIMVVEKRLPNSLIIPESIEKIFKINEYIAFSTSGLIADARRLADYAREDVAAYKMKYGEDIPVVEIVKRISNIKRIYTQYAGIRPFGVSFLIGGIDETGIYLFETDPSGAHKQYFAGAIGEGKEEIDKIFDREYKEDLEYKDAMGLTFRAISAALKKNIKKVSLEIITITKKDFFHKLSDEEIAKLKKEL